MDSTVRPPVKIVNSDLQHTLYVKPSSLDEESLMADSLFKTLLNAKHAEWLVSRTPSCIGVVAALLLQLDVYQMIEAC